jgi:hypothetical protein
MQVMMQMTMLVQAMMQTMGDGGVSDNNGLLKLTNMDWLLFMPLYTCVFVYEFYLVYIIRTQYMIC